MRIVGLVTSLLEAIIGAYNNAQLLIDFRWGCNFVDSDWTLTSWISKLLYFTDVIFASCYLRTLMNNNHNSWWNCLICLFLTWKAPSLLVIYFYLSSMLSLLTDNDGNKSCSLQSHAVLLQMSKLVSNNLYFYSFR